MRRTIAILLAGTVVLLSGCGGWRDARVNPVNWFGGSQPAPAQAAAETGNPLLPEKPRKGIFSRPEKEDRSTLVAAVTEMRVERTPVGAIVYATGLAHRQGAYDVELRASDSAEAGTLEYEFRAAYPAEATPQGSELTRTLRAAASLTGKDLAGITLIRIKSAANVRESRRN